MKLISAFPIVAISFVSLVPQPACGSLLLRAGEKADSEEPTTTKPSSRYLIERHWYGPEGTSGVTTWDQGKAFCEGKGQALPSYRDFCYWDGPPGNRDGLTPTFTPKPGDQWAPASDKPNAYIQVGSGEHKTCTRHESLGTDPAWGTSTDKKDWESNYIMCISDTHQFVVIVKGGIKGGLEKNFETAKATLHNYYTGSRMIAEVINGVVQGDPHKVNGVDQNNDNHENGIRSFWHDWNDIRAMLAVARAFVERGDRGNQCWDRGTPCIHVISCGSCCNPANFWSQCG